MAKGQVEIVVILGIAIVGAVVVLYAYQYGIITPSTVPVGVQQKWQSVKASFESLVQDGSQETLRKLSMYGGYLDNSSMALGSVTFLGKEVPYWQYNGQVKYPNVRENFRIGLTNYLSANKDTVAQALNINGVELGEPQVSVNFLPSRIAVTVNMPTTIDGNRISQPYVTEVQTRLDEIDSFSKAFATYEKESRPLEYYTLSSMIISPMEDNVHTVPLFVFLTECGEYVFKSWYDVKPYMETTIKATLANVYMPGKAPTDFVRTSSSPKYMLVPLDGKRYESLDVAFHLPDEFQLDQSSFRFSPDPITATANMLPQVGLCQSDPVYVNYYLAYPAIVRAKDPLTQNVFQFAVTVLIKDNKPAEWSATPGGMDVQAQICTNPQCRAGLTVRDGSGKPVESASVLFMGCNIGTTDSQGRLNAASPCGLGLLQIYRGGFDAYSKMQSSDNMGNLAVSIVRTPVIRLHFYQVDVQDVSASSRYEVYKDSVSPIGQTYTTYMSFLDIANTKTYIRTFGSLGGQAGGMPAGSYAITGTLLSAGSELGSFVTAFSLPESADGKDLYVYIPTTSAYPQITDEVQKATATAALSNVLTKCGLGPISLTEIKNFNGCTVGYNEV